MSEGDKTRTTKNIPEWFSAWSRKRIEIETPDLNFTPEDEFRKITESIDEKCGRLICNPEINPEIAESNFIEDVFTGKKQGFYYASTDHIHFHQLETRLALLETGALSHPEYFACRSFGRGMGAIASSLMAVASSNNEGTFIRGKTIYTSSKEILDDRGDGRNMIGTKPAIAVDLNNPLNLAELLEERNDIIGVFFEAIENPTLGFNNVSDIAKIAHSFNVPVIVDNTFSPYIYEPFRAGADIVVYSGTKVHSGKGDMTFGFSLHPVELDKQIWAIRKHMGMTPSVNDAYEMAQRVPGYAERMMQHCKNARTIADALNKYESMKHIALNYKSLPGITREGYAGMVVSFDFKGREEDIKEDAYEKGRSFARYVRESPLCDSLKYAVSFGEEKTLCLAWADQLTPEFLKKLNVPPGTVRVCAGREQDINPVIKALGSAIEYSAG
jgi:methionine-gamma-lyase